MTTMNVLNPEFFVCVLKSLFCLSPIVKNTKQYFSSVGTIIFNNNINNYRYCYTFRLFNVLLEKLESLYLNTFVLDSNQLHTYKFGKLFILFGIVCVNKHYKY